MGLRGVRAQKIQKIFRKRIKAHPKSRANEIIQWIEKLPITSGFFVGEKFKLRSWQKQIIKKIYAVDKSGKRIIRQALITMPRKNGKTALTAALALAHLAGPEAEDRGQVYSAAADRKQAALIFDEMKAMAVKDERLKNRIIVREFVKHLEDAKTGSNYFALSSDANTKHGLSPSFIVYDELAQAPDRRLFDVLNTSTGGRKEPLMIVISTQSPDPNSIMSELVRYGERVIAGEKDPAFLPIMYSAPENSDPWDEKIWKACNPALDDFRSLDEMRMAAQQAKRIPAREATFRLLYLNQRVQTESRFIAMPEWDACNAAVDYESLKGQICYGGLDLSTTTDLCALSIVFPGEPFKILPFFWIPEDNLEERIRRDRVPYDVWFDQGYIEATPGNLIDYRYIMLKLGEIRRDFDLRVVAFDRWGSQKIINDLCNEFGFTTDEKEAKNYRSPFLAQFGQGFASMSSPTKELLTMVLGRKIAHGGHPVLRWNASNMVVEQDAAGNLKPSKNRSKERIDGIVATIMALDLAVRNDGEPTNIYEARGVLTL